MTSGEILNPLASEGVASSDAEVQHDQSDPSAAPSRGEETKIPSPLPSPGFNQESNESQQVSPELGNAEISPAGATARKCVVRNWTFSRLHL